MKPDSTRLQIVGLGPGDPGQMSCAAWNAIRAAQRILCRTRIHPTVAALEEQGIRIESCDDLYESSGSFEETYQRVAQRVLEYARRDGFVLFAVPGHPLMGERAVQQILETAGKQGIATEVIPSSGFLDAVLAATGESMNAGVAIFDALAPLPPPPGIPTIYYQVYDRWVASDLKLALLEQLPPDTPICFVQAAGTPDQNVRMIPLLALDRQPCDHLTSLLVSPDTIQRPAPLITVPSSAAPITSWATDSVAQGNLLPDERMVQQSDFDAGTKSPGPGREGRESDMSGPKWASFEPDETVSIQDLESGPDELFLELLDFMQQLRGPEGCPWDREQTFRSLCKYTIEEAYEVVDAVESESSERLQDELGDLLLQVVFHSQIAADEKLFTISDVVRSICAKLVRRHPHVFGDVVASGAQEVIRNWNAIKEQERAAASGAQTGSPSSALDDVPLAVPSMMRADRTFRRAARAGFDWASADEALQKMDEELEEVHRAMQSEGPDAIAAEIGDLLLAVINLARKLQLDSEEVTREALHRFDRRFRAMEQMAFRAEAALSELQPDQRLQLWRQAKASEYRETQHDRTSADTPLDEERRDD